MGIGIGRVERHRSVVEVTVEAAYGTLQGVVQVACYHPQSSFCSPPVTQHVFLNCSQGQFDFPLNLNPKNVRIVCDTVCFWSMRPSVKNVLSRFRLTSSITLRTGTGTVHAAVSQIVIALYIEVSSTFISLVNVTADKKQENGRN